MCVSLNHSEKSRISKKIFGIFLEILQDIYGISEVAESFEYSKIPKICKIPEIYIYNVTSFL